MSVLLRYFSVEYSPEDFDVTPTTVGGCLFHSSLTNWRDTATKLHLFLDDLS